MKINTYYSFTLFHWSRRNAKASGWPITLPETAAKTAAASCLRIPEFSVTALSKYLETSVYIQTYEGLKHVSCWITFYVFNKQCFPSIVRWTLLWFNIEQLDMSWAQLNENKIIWGRGRVWLLNLWTASLKKCL